MDIHKPKPWHSVREFLKEYVIIVVGVLTALAAEQGVEWLHWREQVAQTEAALLPEARANLLSGYERTVLEPCHRERLEELRDLLLKPGSDWKGAPAPFTGVARQSTSELNAAVYNRDRAMPAMYSTPVRPWPQNIWSSALASGVFNHMPRERSAAYASLYRGFEQMRQEQDDQDAAKGRLSALAYDRKLTEAEKTEFLNVIGALDQDNALMSRGGAAAVTEADRYGIQIKTSDVEAMMRRLGKSARVGCYKPIKIPLAAG